MDFFRNIRFDKDAYIFTFTFFFVAVVLNALSSKLGLIGFVLTAWCLYFFRDPIRTVPYQRDLVISPADGVVSLIKKVKAPAELDLDKNKEYIRVSIFLNVFNVHVNRTPVAGKITSIEKINGKFFNASLDKASEHNERTAYVVETKSGAKVGFTQIAGLVARRIRIDVKQGQSLEPGERIGLIRFGSRMDVYLPEGIEPVVGVGQSMIAGETIIASLDPKLKISDLAVSLEFKKV